MLKSMPGSIPIIVICCKALGKKKKKLDLKGSYHKNVNKKERRDWGREVISRSDTMIDHNTAAQQVLSSAFFQQQCYLRMGRTGDKIKPVLSFQYSIKKE